MEIDGIKREETLDPSDVFHIVGPSHDTLKPPRLIQKARDSWALGLAAEKYEASFFKNGNRVGGYLMIPSHFSEKAAENLEIGFKNKTSGAAGWFQTIIMRDGAKFEKNGFSMQEMMMDEVRKEQVRDVARWFQIAPSRLGLAENSSYNSKSEDNRDFLDTTLSPWMEAVTSEAWDKLLSERQKDRSTHEFMYNTSVLLRMNPKDQAAVDAMNVRNKLRVPNEIRKRDGLKPLPGGDEPIAAPGSPAPGSSDGGVDKQPNDGQGAVKGEPNEPDPDENEQNSARNRVLYHLTAVARHKAKNPNAFIELIDGGLKSFRDQAVTLSVDDSFITLFCGRCKELAESVSAKDLPAAVDDLCKQFEENPDA